MLTTHKGVDSVTASGASSLVFQGRLSLSGLGTGVHLSNLCRHILKICSVVGNHTKARYHPDFNLGGDSTIELAYARPGTMFACSPPSNITLAEPYLGTNTPRTSRSLPAYLAQPCTLRSLELRNTAACD
jgi:hypothetical protein